MIFGGVFGTQISPLQGSSFVGSAPCLQFQGLQFGKGKNLDSFFNYMLCCGVELGPVDKDLLRRSSAFELSFPAERYPKTVVKFPTDIRMLQSWILYPLHGNRQFCFVQVSIYFLAITATWALLRL